MHDETTYPFERKAFHSECPSPTKPLLVYQQLTSSLHTSLHIITIASI
jgi:hypothetical protein